MINNIKKMLRPLYRPLMDAYRQKMYGPKRYHHLFDEIRRLNASHIVEVGTWNGKRAVQMIKTAQQLSNDVTYVGFDLFEELTDEMYKHELSKKPPTRAEVEEIVGETGAQIKLIQGNTLETLPAYVIDAEKADFIFIDGGHSVETIRSDWEAVSKLMHENTVVIFDDYWRNRPDQSAKPVVDAIDATQYTVEILPEIDKFKNTEFGDLEISFAKVTRK